VTAAGDRDRDDGSRDGDGDRGDDGSPGEAGDLNHQAAEFFECFADNRLIKRPVSREMLSNSGKRYMGRRSTTKYHTCPKSWTKIEVMITRRLPIIDR